MEEDSFFKNSSKYMKSLIGKTATVTTIENKPYSGTVYVIDPVSKTLVLSSKAAEGKQDLDFIMYHSIKTFEVTSDAVHSVTNEEVTDDAVEDSPELLTRRKRLLEWLRRNLIEVEEKGSSLVLADQSVITPPYGPEQCMCSNTIVLERIRTIISNMPNADLT